MHLCGTAQISVKGDEEMRRPQAALFAEARLPGGFSKLRS